MMDMIQVLGKRFDAPRRPLFRVTRSRDKHLAEATNALVAAVTELQVCVNELQEWVKAQPPANPGSSTTDGGQQ